MLLWKEQNQLHYILPSAMQDTCELHSPPQIIESQALLDLLSLELPLYWKCFTFTTKTGYDTKRKSNFPGVYKCFCPHLWHGIECEDERT